ncbi:unnamed protein product [Rhodiola kirilowii]
MLSEVQFVADEVAALAKDSESSSPDDFLLVINELSSIIDELNRNNDLTDTVENRKAVNSLGSDLSRARVLLTSEVKTSKSVTGQLEELTRDMGRSLGLVMLTGVDVPEEVKERIGALRKGMNIMISAAGSSSPELSCESDFGTGSEPVGEIEEVNDDEDVQVGIEDVVLQIKNGGGGGDEEELMLALWALTDFIREKTVGHEWIQDTNTVEILSSKLSLVKSSNVRSTIIKILLNLVAEYPDYKERMVDVGSLSTLVKSLAREAGERREAVGLLLALSDVPVARRRIGRIQGCILMLVSMLKGDDQIASCHSLNLLNELSDNTQNALHMAEAGYFKPLVQHLNDGSDMCKILMATALSRIQLTDQNRAALGQEGAIETLANMFNTGKMEAKLSALNALHNLSGLPENVQRLIDSGIVPLLLQLLFSVTSVLMTLREPAAAILARIAQSESILVNRDVAQQMLSLLSLSSPSIKDHLLHALNSICNHSRASRVRKKMTESGAFQLLLPFLSESNNGIRAAAVNLLYTLSKYFPAELSEQLGETYLVNIVDIISSSLSEDEKAAGVGLLSNLPISDKRATEALLRANALPILLSMLESSLASSTPVKCWVTESISSILIRFTIPSDKKLQRYSAQHEVIPLLVKLLSCESSSIIAKCRAATSLAQLSQNSLSLRKPRKWKWVCAPPSADSFCQVHDGYCHVKTTYCLVKAKAVAPLIQILQSKERAADKSVLSAISTLLDEEIWENGANILAESSGIQAIVKVLEFGPVKVQEKCLWILERVFRNEAHRKQFGEVAEGVLIDLAQKADSKLKPAVAKILAQLELLQMQSSYF